jgi:hypothetical protein
MAPGWGRRAGRDKVPAMAIKLHRCSIGWFNGKLFAGRGASPTA